MSLPTELNPDRSRQATHAFRGYAYQAYQTIRAWLKTCPGEEVLVEFAEDIDLVRRDSDGNVTDAELYQVKNEKGNVTLNSPSACDLINHFFDHRLRNPGIKLSIHLCTISDRGTEMEMVWGYSDRGLDLWDMLRERKLLPRDLDEACSILRKFLRGSTKLERRTQTFLDSCDNSLFLTDFVDLIFWDTGQQSYGAIQKEIEHILAVRPRNIVDPMEVGQVIDRLWRYVTSAIAGDCKKTLSFESLEKLLAQETSVVVDRKTITDMQSGIVKVEHSMSEVQKDVQALVARTISGVFPQGGVAILHQQVFSTSLPPLPARYCSRESVLDGLFTASKARTMLWIWGSTGYGKSILANLLLRRCEGTTNWFNLRGYSDFALASALSDLINRYQASDETGLSVALDDLKIENQSSYSIDLLQALVQILKEKRSTVVVTSQLKPPTRLMTGIADSLFVFDAPAMTLLEVTSLIDTTAVLSDELKAFWSNYICVMSRRHPQLVSAYVSWAAEKQWVVRETELFQRPASVEEVIVDARKLLADAIPSREGRELARRLSLIAGHFTRDFALDLALGGAGITEPGRAFDTLVGPWIEIAGDNIYILSPLLTDYAKSEVGERNMVSYYTILGHAFLKQISLTPLQAVQAVGTAIFAKLQPLLAKTCCALWTLSDEVFEAISSDLFLLTFYVGDQTTMFSGIDPHLTFMLRMLQLKIALLNQNHSIYLKIDDLILRELDVEFRRGQALLYYIETVIRLDNPIQNIEKTRRAIEALRIQKQDGRKSDPFDELFEGLPTQGILVLACSTIQTREELQSFFEMLSKQTSEVVSLALEDFEVDVESIPLLIDRVWLHEGTLTNPNWTQCDQLFSSIASFAVNYKHNLLLASALRGRMVIHDEYLNDPHTALRIATEASQQLAKRHPLIMLQESTVYYRMKNYEEALSRIIQLEKSLPDNALAVERLFMLRRGLHSAENLEAWDDLIFCARKGQVVSRAVFQPMSSVANIAFRAEEGWGMHQTGHIIPAARLFMAVLEDMQAYPEQQNPLFHILRLRFGHMLNWISKASGETLLKPSAGMLANFEEPPIESKDKTAAPYPLAWSFLGKYVEWLPGKDLIAIATDQAMMAIEGKQDYLAVMTAREALFGACLVVGDYGGALANGLEYSRLFVGGGILREEGGGKWTVGQLINIDAALGEHMDKVHEKWQEVALFFVFEPLLMAICSSLRPTKPDMPKLAAIVHRTIGTHSEINEALKWLEMTAGAMLGGENEKRTIIAYISDYKSLPAAIQRFPMIVCSGMFDLGPAMVLSCQGSLLKIARDLSGNTWAVMFCRMVATYWRRFATERPFALLHPRISVSAIKEQASNESPTVKECAQLLLLVSDAIGLPFPPEMLSYIRATAEEAQKT